MYYWEVPALGARGRPHGAAVASGNTLSWQQLGDRVSRLATVISRNLQSGPGRRIGILLRNSWQYPELCYGITKARCVAVPLNWRASAPERAVVVANAGIDLVFAAHDLAGLIDSPDVTVVPVDGSVSSYERDIAAAAPRHEALPEADTDDLAMLVYSSGTTDEPKGAMHSHRTLMAGALRLSYEMRLRAGQVFYGCLPFFFAGAQSTMTAPLMSGCTLFIEEFEPDRFLNAIAEHGVTATIMVPTMIKRVIEAAVALPAVPAGMRSWVYGGAPMPEHQLAAAVRLFGPVFTQFYGQVETGLLATALQPEDALAAGSGRSGSVGRPAIGTQVRLVAPDGELGSPDAAVVAEIAVRTDGAMLGYWQRPELTAATMRDGWVHTGDLGRQNEGGFVHVVGRLREMIITGGINVFPREIEDLVRAVSGVEEVAVLGMPSDEWGEEVVAFVAAGPGTDAPALEEAIRASCRRHLAGYKVPRQIMIGTSPLPATGSGKVAKAELRRRFLESAPNYGARLGGAR